MKDFKTQDLFGGAIECPLPNTFIDLRYDSQFSEFRQIPDYQELFSDKNSTNHMILELLDIPEDASDILE